MTNAGRFSIFDDDALEAIFTLLDFKTLLRLAGTCKRFRTFIFQSHASVVWRHITILSTRNFRCHVPVLQRYAGITESLCFPDYTPPAHEMIENLPLGMRKMKHLRIGSPFEMDLRAVGGLAAKCPALVSIVVPRARWHYNTLGIARQAFPLLAHLEIDEFRVSDGAAQQVDSRQLSDIVDTLDGFQTTRVDRLWLLCNREPRFVPEDDDHHNPIDLLARSNLGKGIVGLWVDLKGLGRCSPQTSIGMFESLESLTIQNSDRNHTDWLITMSAAGSGLAMVYLRYCEDLDRVWAKLPHFPRGLCSLDLFNCSDVNANLMNVITCPASASFDLAITSTAQHPMEFCLSESVKKLLGTYRRSGLVLQGPLSSDHNSTDELTRVYNHLMQNADALEGILVLHLKDLTLVGMGNGAENGNAAAEPIPIELGEGCSLSELGRRFDHVWFNFGSARVNGD